VAADVVQHAPLVPESRANSATSWKASTPGDSLDDLVLQPMRQMPVSPPSAGVADRALLAVDWPGGLAPSLARQGSLQASLQMVLAEQELLSSPRASQPASRPASRPASPTQFLLQILAQALLRSSPERASLRALVRFSLEQILLQPLAQVSLERASPRSSQARVP